MAHDTHRSIFSSINMSTFGATLHPHHTLVATLPDQSREPGGVVWESALSMVLVVPTVSSVGV